MLSPRHEPRCYAAARCRRPLHLALRARALPAPDAAERVGAARAAFALDAPGLQATRRSKPRRSALGSRATGRASSAVGALWDLIALPTLNLPAAEASLALAAFVFRTGLLSERRRRRHRLSPARSDETIGDPAERALREAGVEVRLGWRAERIERSGDGVAVHGRGDADVGARCRRGRRSRCPTCVPRGCSSRCSVSAPAHGAGWAARRSSICTSSMTASSASVPFAAGVGTPVQYVFDRSDAAGVPPGCQYLAVSLSGAEREMAISSSELRERYLPALGALFPRARGASVEFFLATREHAATFRAAPGVGALRPQRANSAAGTGARRRLDRDGLAGHARGSRAERSRGSRHGAARPRSRAGERRSCAHTDQRHWSRSRTARAGRSASGAGARPVSTMESPRELLVAAPMRIEAALISSGTQARAGAKDRHGPQTLAGRRGRPGRGQRPRDARARLLRWTRRDVGAGRSDRRRRMCTRRAMKGTLSSACVATCTTSSCIA